MRKMLDMSVLLLRVAGDATQRIADIDAAHRRAAQAPHLRRERRVRALLAGIAVVALGGCDFLKGGGSEIAQCEAFVKGQLLAPSTYKRVNAMAFDSSLLTAREYQERLGDPVPPPESRLRLRDVSLTYEAENALGVPLEKFADCQFKVTEDEREGELISPLASSRETEDRIARERALEAAQNPPEENPFGTKPVSLRAPCCLPPPGR